MKRLLILISVAALAAFVAACGGDDNAASKTPTPAAGSPTAVGATPTDFPDSGPVTLRLGYYANVTHAVPLVGLNNGIFQQELGSSVSIDQKTFNAGPDVINALFAGALDASYIGQSPAVNGYVQSDGNDVRIVSGAASGGASLVVQPGIAQPSDLKGKKIASPQLGNTQDISLRNWLKQNGIPATENGGDVQVIPTANADSLTAFENKQIDGAWVPEPWGTRLVQEGAGHVLVNENDLWPNGQFATTVLIVRTDFLNKHPDIVEKLVSANIKTVAWIKANTDQAEQLTNQAITTITGKGLKDATIKAAWPNVQFTYDPIASSVRTAAEEAYDLGLLQNTPDLKNLFDLSILNRVLAKQELPTVAS